MNLDRDYFEMCFRLLAALAAGGIIGLERSYRGRAAGFRTHALVCVASALLMLVTVYESLWFAGAAARTSLDPTRMAQGIMTGIGFLGAGVIVKEGLTVRGLTTAASIWMTAAIGILTGIGFYFPAGIAAVLALGTLSVFRWIEGRMPSEFYANFLVRFPRNDVMPEAALRQLVAEHGFSVANMSYRIAGQGREFEYQMVLRTLHAANVQNFSARLASEPTVTEFRIAPTGD
ncbi:MAG TPA: MgtC/SapB family protein [Burkholderiales bacterium]|nr:MgtC/SapB family protein [Burkholderiales bacterium]